MFTSCNHLFFPLSFTPPNVHSAAVRNRNTFTLFPGFGCRLFRQPIAAGTLVTPLDPPADPARHVVSLLEPSRGFLLIRRAAWAVRRSGLWYSLRPGGGGLPWYSAPWGLFPLAFPAVRGFVLAYSLKYGKIFFAYSLKNSYKKSPPVWRAGMERVTAGVIFFRSAVLRAARPDVPAAAGRLLSYPGTSARSPSCDSGQAGTTKTDTDQRQ